MPTILLGFCVARSLSRETELSSVSVLSISIRETKETAAAKILYELVVRNNYPERRTRARGCSPAGSATFGNLADVSV